MDITITINTDNAAFSRYPAYEIARILAHARVKVQNAVGLHDTDFARELDGCKLRDVNGNTVGTIAVTA